jgi:hypothetical protein
MTPYFDTNCFVGLLLAATRPGYARPERQAFGSSPAADDVRPVPPRSFRSPPGGTMFQSYPGRLAAAVAAATVGLLASAIPPAFAQQTQATVHHAAGGGLAGWQIALIGVGVPLAATAVIVLVRWVQAARRGAPSPNA